MKKNNLSSYFVFISFFTCITLFILIVQKSYSNILGPTQQIKVDQFLDNIDPNLNLEVLKQIEARKEYTIIQTTQESTVSSEINPSQL
jgi:hypothetical protein